MKQENKLLKKVFYEYWKYRVPELDEDEAIDHLEYELRNANLLPSSKKEKTC